MSYSSVIRCFCRPEFSIGFEIIAQNKLCDQQKFMILKYFVHHDNLHIVMNFEA